MKALITGITGQDGAYLARLLLEKGYEVTGTRRRGSSANTWRLEELGILDKIAFEPMELSEFSNILRVIEKTEPDEIYNLAALSYVGVTFEQPIFAMDINALGPVRILEATRQVNPEIKFYQASTSELYGHASEDTLYQDELTPFKPQSPYAIAKLAAHWAVVNYRESYGLHAVSGILFNHESPLRGIEFVTRKITDGLARIKLGKQDVLRLGNLEAKRDWGFAGDYVKGMWQMLQSDTSCGDYVLATGECYSVGYFAEKAGQHLGMDITWKGQGTQRTGRDGTNKVIEVDESIFRPSDLGYLRGDYGRAKRMLGWEPEVGIDGLAKMMVNADLQRIESGMPVL